MAHSTSAGSRRLFLQGTGVAMSLPWLESLPVWGREAAARPPRRFAAMFMGNGVHQSEWYATGSGKDIEFGNCLKSLEPLKEHVNVISGLFNENATGVGIHPGQTGNILSGVSLQKGAVLKGGISIDQLLAKHFEQETLQSSVVLGCEQPVTGYHETNYSMAYSSHISWRNVTAPVPMEIYPSLAFDSLFDNHGSRRTQSILDRVSEHANFLNRQVSHEDRLKIDEYLSSVRDVEKRIERARAMKGRADQRARDKATLAWTMDRPDNGMPEAIREHLRLMCDIIAMAFQTDHTRVASLLMCRDISGLVYPFLDVRISHHFASHKDDEVDYERISAFYCQQLAYLAGKLQSMPEGDSSVLDNSLLLFVNNMWSGKAHDSSKVPVLTAGGLGGTVKTGRVLDYQDRGDENRRLCSLYLSIMDRMGVRQDSFGDTSDRLADF
ncbi:MAG: DUF1552 domain-containing protein [Planctomycetaceae bacterium]